MKKLLKHCILLTGIICLLSGCSGTDGTSDASEGNGQSTDTAAVNTQTASDLDVSPEDYEGKDYHFDTDYQSFFFMPNIAKGEAGYYYWEENDERLYYYDTATAQSVVLCNKADCTHDDDTCNAYFNAAKKENQDDRTQLYRSCQSGTERNDVCGKERTGTPADPADPCINGMERDRSSSAVRRCHDHLAARDRSGRREDTCFSFTDNVSWEAAAVSDHSFYVYDGGDLFSMAGSLSVCADPVVCISAVGTCDPGLRGGYDPVLSGICDLAGDRSEFFLTPVEILQSMVSAVFQ